MVTHLPEQWVRITACMTVFPIYFQETKFCLKSQKHHCRLQERTRITIRSISTNNDINSRNFTIKAFFQYYVEPGLVSMNFCQMIRNILTVDNFLFKVNDLILKAIGGVLNLIVWGDFEGVEHLNQQHLLPEK